MNKKYTYLLVVAALMLATFSAFAQQVNVNYEVNVNNVTSYENDPFGACFEIGDEEYTAYVSTQDELGGGNGNSGCQTCDNNGDCTYAQNVAIPGATGGNTAAEFINVSMDAWEDDDCGRCTYEGFSIIPPCLGDDCRRNGFQGAYEFRNDFPSAPNTFSNTSPTYGSTNDHEVAVNVSWRYTGVSNPLFPDPCMFQAVTANAGIINSWSFSATAGATYTFSTCGGTTDDTYIRIYGPDGFTIVDENDDFCGLQSEIDFVAPTTDTYYVEVSEFLRDPLPNGATFMYRTADTEDPVIVCPANVIQGTDPDVCDAVVASMGMPSIIDNCPGPYTFFNTLNGTTDGNGIFQEGINPVVWIAEDVAGNTSSCTMTVLIIDDQNPFIGCAPTVMADNDSGVCTATGVVLPAPVTSDNCGVLTFSNNAPPIYPVGTTDVTWTIFDINSNVDVCVTSVVVSDVEDPAIVCANIDVTLDAAGGATIAPSDVDGGTADNCGGFTLMATPLTFTCAEVGANTVTLSASDASGNTSDCVAIVTVVNTTTMVCQATTVMLDAAGSATVAATDIDNGSSSVCGGLTLAVQPNVFTCAEVGDNPVLLIGTDSGGSTASCATTVTVVDDADPLAVCQDITVELSATTGMVSITEADIDGGSSDNCNFVLTAAPTAFDCATIGVNPVTLVATDDSGNTDECVANVTVEDNSDPIIFCTPVSNVNDPNVCEAALTIPVPITFDNCPVTLVNDYNGTSDASDTYPVGLTLVTWTVTDAGGNTSDCVMPVQILDVEAPTIICPADIAQDTDPGVCEAFVSVPLPFTSDNCGVAPLSLSNSYILSATGDASAVYPLGTTTVVWTVRDNNNLFSVCTTDIVITDNEMPMIACNNIEVFLDADGNASIVDADIDANISDNCGLVSSGVTPNSFTCAEVGANDVTLSALDVNGNSASCVAVVTVTDAIAPTAICVDLTVEVDATGNVSISVTDVDGGSSDVCGVLSVEAAPTAFNCDNLGDNTVVLTVTDVNNNTASCNAIVTVEDNIAPTITCPADVQTCDLDGFAEFDDPTASDNCSIASIDVSVASGTLFPIGVTTITGTATDIAGNTATCTFTVTYSPLRASITPSNYNGFGISCNGGSDGEATVNPTGGFPPSYSYLWSDGQTTQTATGLSAGLHSVQVTDDFGCMGMAVVFLTEPPVLVCDVESMDITCNGDADGSAEVFATGGVAPYTYAWSNGAVTQAINSLTAGDYTVTVTDGNGCVCVNTATIVEPDLVEIQAGAGNVTEGGGTASPFVTNLYSATICGGSGLFDVDLTSVDGYVRYAFVDLGDGCYELLIKYTDNADWTATLTDSNGCGDATTVLTNSDPDTPNIASEDITNAMDCIEGDGAIDLVVEGGTPPYNYSWSGFACPCPNSASISGLTSGWYDVTVSDANGAFTTGAYWVACCKPGRDCNPKTGVATSADELKVYPNPFETEATIEFVPTEDGQLQVDVYNLEGRVVAQVFNGQVAAGQDYQASFSAGDLPSGIYIVRLTTETGNVVYERLVLANGK